MIESILDALLEPALLLDGAGRVVIANASARERLGVWVIGRSYVSVLRQPALLSPVEDAYAKNDDGVARFIHSSGEVETPFEVRVTPMSGGDGTRHVLLVFRDLSEVHAGESMRRDFVANVSHELKTPLTAISGFIETLQGPARDDADARTRFLGMMAQEAARMNRLVGDLLSLSRLEGQSRKRPTDMVDLIEVVTETLRTLQPGAEVEGVEIVSDLPDRAGVLADRDQIVQVLTNLIENAVKYGHQPGRIALTLKHVAREPVIRGPAWRLIIRDDGVGIAPEHIPRLTERFYRVDTGRSRAQGGTGLGLAIVKHIVNRHRGRMRIESVPGQGTTVSITLPAA
ncbi:sensor histidine kinase [Jannaschia donghaensis]|uniref:histidine kinase n=1 Tax=Jannaschia donghaensis TaxID=420998 RepID=A0A0M6YLA4_9RHOB|nr:ATP-binding protein [Jannaschia donghaensis]CTQ50710.1 Alkaline phosphatase synthesis sensor protein PhoR [Jannaschia donghaensis]